MSLKQEVMKTLAQLPDEASEEVLDYHFHVALLVNGRLAASNPQKLTTEEAKASLKRWLE